MKFMRRKNRNPLYLIVGVFGVSTLAWFINAYPPDKPFRIVIFLGLIGFSSTFLSLFLFKNVRRAILLSSGLTVFLLLRYLGLREPLYLILLLASLVSLELSLRKR